MSDAVSVQVSQRRFMNDAADRVTAAVSIALTLPTEGEQMEALLTTIDTERLTSVADEIRTGAPTQSASSDDTLLDEDTANVDPEA